MTNVFKSVVAISIVAMQALPVWFRVVLFFGLMVFEGILGYRGLSEMGTWADLGWAVVALYWFVILFKMAVDSQDPLPVAK